MTCERKRRLQLEQARIAVELEPVSPLIRSLRCAVLGRWDEYVANQIVRSRELGLLWLVDVLERSYPASGFESTMSEAADTMLARTSRGEWVGPVMIARYLADGGLADEALDWLERALELRAPALPYQVDRKWPEEVASNPRFRAVFERMGLPPRD